MGRTLNVHHACNYTDSQTVFLAAAGYPDPPNFGPPPKIRRKKCGCRKRRWIL